MICYHESLTEDEIAAINDYWAILKDTPTAFKFTTQELQNFYQMKPVRGISKLAKLCSFAIFHPAFMCAICKCKNPVQGRQEYSRRMKVEEIQICEHCMAKHYRNVFLSAEEEVKQFKEENLAPEEYLQKLSIEENLALLSISSKLTGNLLYICESVNEINITGCLNLDRNLFVSLVNKKALKVISKIPESVRVSNDYIYDEYDKITYHNENNNQKKYRHPNSLEIGIYLTAPIISGEAQTTNISNIIYQNLYRKKASHSETESIYHIIKEMQIDKLYKMVKEISNTYGLAIENSNSLRALLNHLAENYAPLNINFTFNMKAKDSILYIHKERVPSYVEKNLFTRFVGDYLQLVEEKNWELNKSWELPPNIEISSFEALFSHAYLDGHFNWNRLSTKKIVALWLNNVDPLPATQGLPTDRDR